MRRGEEKKGLKRRVESMSSQLMLYKQSYRTFKGNIQKVLSPILTKKELQKISYLLTNSQSWGSPKTPTEPTRSFISESPKRILSKLQGMKEEMRRKKSVKSRRDAVKGESVTPKKEESYVGYSSSSCNITPKVHIRKLKRREKGREMNTWGNNIRLLDPSASMSLSIFPGNSKGMGMGVGTGMGMGMGLGVGVGKGTAGTGITTGTGTARTPESTPQSAVYTYTPGRDNDNSNSNSDHTQYYPSTISNISSLTQISIPSSPLPNLSKFLNKSKVPSPNSQIHVVNIPTETDDNPLINVDFDYNLIIDKESDSLLSQDSLGDRLLKHTFPINKTKGPSV